MCIDEDEGDETHMANTMLEGSAISAFCGGVAVMIAAGIQVDEAVYMLAGEHEDSQFKTMCTAIYLKLGMPAPLAAPVISTVFLIVSPYLSLMISTPGKPLPSKNSSDAPPPVETWLTLSA